MQLVIKVLVLSLVVGLLLAALGIDPVDILRGTWNAVIESPRAIFDAVAWTIPHILRGAIIVVPIVAIGALLRYLQGRRPKPPPPVYPPEA